MDEFWKKDQVEPTEADYATRAQRDAERILAETKEVLAKPKAGSFDPAKFFPDWVRIAQPHEFVTLDQAVEAGLAGTLPVTHEQLATWAIEAVPDSAVRNALKALRQEFYEELYRAPATPQES